MKALVLNSQGQKDEAFTLAKQALKCDMKSHVCWHVYGLLYKDAKNFEEAIKAYKFALKLQPDSLQIQRDLAFLQMQFRDYTGYIQSRHAMLQANPDQRQNWTALAVAQHFGGQLENAENTLSIYEETLKNPPPKTDDRHQQAGLYKNMIIAEMGETERALEHLNAVGKTIYDKQLVMELRAEYLLKLNRKSEAEEVYWELLRRNQENRAYYRGLQSAKSISESDVKALQTMYEECLTKYPNSDACQRIPLDFLAGKDFREAADGYLRRIYKVPSAFSNIKALYSEHSKQEVIQELMEGYRESCLSETTNGTIKSESTKDDLETTILFFLAQHYNYHKSRDLSKALQFIEQAIERNPKSVDYQMTKARILKHKGNVQKASEVMEYARSLDTRDRYINTKAAKYQLRNNEHENALKTMSNFTRQDAAGGTLGDLVDMQSVWFLTEDGESYLRQNKLGLALKRSHWIYNIFDLWQEDQYDFHSFSFRRGQIRAYVDMIRWEDHLRDHPFYTRASILAIKAYLFLHDKPDVARGNLPNGVNGDKMDAKEKKKVARKARIEQEKKEQAEAEKKNAKLAAGGSTENEQKKVDKDPEGMQFLETQDPLKEALKFLLPMLESSTKSLEAQKAGFEVFLRRSMFPPVMRNAKIKLTSNREISARPSLFSCRQIYRARFTNLPQPASSPGARRSMFLFLLTATSNRNLRLRTQTSSTTSET